MFIKKAFFVLFLFFSFLSTAQQLAFPTAEGIGRFTTGGRGTSTVPTTVFYVTNLLDNNVNGSLRFALSQNVPHRTIIFNVSGTIHLNSSLTIRANTTIAGQTAPAGGICIADYPVSLGGNNIIVRYIRFRLGDKNQLKTTPANCGVPVAPFTSACMPINGSGGDDVFGGTGRKNIVIDHCTMSWSNDELCSIYEGDSTTIQWCMLSEPLNYSFHFESGDTDFQRHGFGGIWGGRNATFHHNLFAHVKGRACRFDGSRNLDGGTTPGKENCEFSNNVIFNWGDYNVNGGEGGNYNVRNNYYKFGLSTNSGATRRMVINPFKASPLPYGKFFLSGNFVDGSTANTNNNWLGASISGGSLADTATIKVTTPFPNLGLTNLQSATAAYNDVLLDVGATLPSRDTLDQRIILNVINRTGRLIDVQGGFPRGTPYANTVTAWPTLKTGNVSTDSDLDGMPNWWENLNGLNQNLASDRAIISANGYTNLENYLNNIPAWNNHANYTNFSGNKINNNLATFNFSTHWVKDSFTYALFRSPDSLGVYTKVSEVSSSMNNINFSLNDNNLLATTAFYKVGSYRVGVTPDTLYTNIIRIEGSITPATILKYYLKQSNNSVVNNWFVGVEENVKGYNVQRSSNLSAFENIGYVEAKGSNNNYTFTDAKPIEKAFYRLQIIDKDGKINYSDVKFISIHSILNNANIVCYPNPSTTNLNITSKLNIVDIKIFNSLQQLVYSSKFTNKNIVLPVNNLPKGIYALTITTQDNIVNYEKIIVQ